MGYMGFGMQKWIYTQKPKKGFSKAKKIYGEYLNRLPKGNELIEDKSISIEARKALLLEIKNSYRKEKAKQLGVLIVSLILAVAICYVISLVVKDFLLQ